MKKTQILLLTFLFAAIAIGLSIYMVRSIQKPIAEKKRIDKIERQIVSHLKFIRAAQQLHLGNDGVYAENLKQLSKYIKTGKLYRIEKELIPVDGDSSYYKIDTLKDETMLVKDSLLKGEFSNINIDSVMFIPGKKKAQFEMFVSVLKSVSGDTMYGIQVKDIQPFVNPNRKSPLLFGSETDISTKGNWEF